MKFGENLQKIRKLKNLSQEDLAEMLEVSRQAVSKWESGTGFPEAEKLIAISEVLNCSLDDLLKGKIDEKKNDADMRVKYDDLINRFSKSISIGVMLILIGVTLFLAISGLEIDAVEDSSTLGLAVMLLFVTIAVPIFVIRGIEMESFKKKYSELDKIYSDEEIERYDTKFSKILAFGIGIILAGVIAFFLASAINSNAEGIPVVILLTFVTVAVPIIIYAGIQKDKYDIAKYNKENSKAFKEKDGLVEKYSGIIMITATIIYFLISFLTSGWHLSWIVFPIGGLMCGIVSLLFQDND